MPACTSCKRPRSGSRQTTTVWRDRVLVEQLVGIERLIDQHVAQSLSAHSTEIRAVYALTRDLHRHLTNDAEIGADCLWPAALPGSDAHADS
jgi:hypothetical protein